MSKYYEWGDFKNIYLEDSFVLGIEEPENQITFKVEMVLTEDHPLYISPREDEQYCYKKGKIIFRGARSINWINRNSHPFTDADGSEDYGNIDLFELSSNGYHLSGDWGEVVINSPAPKIEWLA